MKLKVHDSVFVPLAKWAMLLAGNYRCVTKDGPRAIKEAVHSDLEASRAVYDWVVELCVSLGAAPRRPGAVREVRQRGAGPGHARPRRRARCSPARRTSSASTAWCRPSRRRRACSHPVVDETVALVDARLELNRSKAA